jgi:hypothetical protein
MKKDNNNTAGRKGEEKISRKEALKKAGYAAFSAATMMLLLNDPAKAQTTSRDTEDGAAKPDAWEFEGWD